MKKLGLSLLCALALTFTAVSLLMAAPITVVDDGGATVTLPRPPRRIVSLTPAVTEMLFAVGAGPRVVGGTTADDYPPAALKLARIGGWSPSYEKIVAIRPDLAVVDDTAEAAAAVRLRSLHIPVLVIRPVTVAAIEADLTLIGRATGNAVGAGAAMRSMETKLREASTLARRDRARPRVLPLIGHDPLFVAGSGTFIDDAVRRAGGVNVAGSIHGYSEYSPEAALASHPDIILAGPDDVQALTQTPALRAMAAVRARRFALIDPALLQRPGPRIADGVLALARALHPGR